nr:MAG TPA_asm: hypothetical protein [Caudoviricetes sp.]
MLLTTGKASDACNYFLLVLVSLYKQKQLTLARIA